MTKQMEHTVTAHMNEKGTLIENTAGFDTDQIHVAEIRIGLNPESPEYGKIHAMFEYKDQLIMLRFNIHTPDQGSPHLSNRLEKIKKFIPTTISGMEIVLPEDDYTDETWEDPEIKKLVKNIKKYSQKNKLTALIRKNDARNRKWRKERYGQKEA